MIIINARFLTQKITGVQRFAVEISRQLYKLDNTIKFVSPLNIIHHKLAKELNAQTIGRYSGTLWEQITLRRFLLNLDSPLLINFCNNGLLFYRNQIVTIHDMSYKINPGWFSKKFAVWYNLLIPQLCTNSLKILTVSASAKKDILRFIKVEESKIEIIYNATDFDNKTIYQNPQNEKFILSVSSLDPRKNLNNIIRAFNLIDSKVKLIIVGLKSNNFGSSYDLNLINENIIFKSYLRDDELKALMQHAELFLYMSFYEGFGLPPVEAMAMDTAVIVSDIAAHREICGDAALFANPNDIEDIKAKVDLLLTNTDLQKQLVMKGRLNIERFDWLKSAKKTLAIIHDPA